MPPGSSFSTLTPLPGTFTCASCCQATFNADFGFFFHETGLFLSTKNERQHRALLLPPASSLAWLEAPRALHLTIQVRSDTLAKRKKHTPKCEYWIGTYSQEASSSPLPLSLQQGLDWVIKTWLMVHCVSQPQVLQHPSGMAWPEREVSATTARRAHHHGGAPRRCIWPLCTCPQHIPWCCQLTQCKFDGAHPE